MYQRLDNDYVQIDTLSNLCAKYWLQENFASLKDAADGVRRIAKSGSSSDEEYEYKRWSTNLSSVDYYCRGLPYQAGYKQLYDLQTILIKPDNGCNDFEFIGYFLGLCVSLSFARYLADRSLLTRLSRRWLHEIGKSSDSLFVSQQFSRLATAEHSLGNVNQADYYSKF